MTLTVDTPARATPLDVLTLRPRKRDAVLAAMLECATESGALRESVSALRLLLARERLGPAVLASGVAIPHARSILVARTHLVVGRSERGVAWPGRTERVHLVVMVLSPGLSPAGPHERLVARVAHSMRQVRTRRRLEIATDFESTRLALREVFA